ncbi:MAG: TonB-dependent receptor, partial [Candidatus Latescibacteria bacterium]|nr:TonB-dependent receptor [Candidatus Latescibacterota bacterium]
PLTLDDVERIEILRGHGSRLYGPNAFGGVINIITRTNQRESVELEAVAGGFGFAEGTVSLSLSDERWSHRLSASGRRSGGYRDHTDFRTVTGSYRAALRTDRETITLSVGHTDKAFGANGFYSDRFTNEWERTIATLLGVQADLARGDVQFSANSYFRRHKDDFILDRARPEWFRNRHATDLYGVEAQAIVSSELGDTAVGGEVAREVIRSETLGDRSRVRGGLSFEHRAKLARRATLVPGASAYWYPGWGWAVQPGLDVGLTLGRGVGIHASVGRSFRVPTYTELYYSSPANMGNPDLVPEEAWAYEVGVRRQGQALSGSASVFRREGRHLIDWVRADPADPWQVQNAAETSFSGLELAIDYDPQARERPVGIPRVRIGYDYLRASRTSGQLRSKYLLDHLRHRISLGATQGLGRGLEHAWHLRYRERVGVKSQILLDAKVSWTRGRTVTFVEVTNLLDTSYADIGSIRMPGRWVMAGLRVGM